jgi:hypothetical protein
LRLLRNPPRAGTDELLTRINTSVDAGAARIVSAFQMCRALLWAMVSSLVSGLDNDTEDDAAVAEGAD